MKSAHTSFNVFLKLEQETGKRIAFVSELTCDRSMLYRWVPSHFLKQVAYQTIKSLDMAYYVARFQKPDLIFIFEHKPQYAIILYIACIAKRVPVLFFIHGVQQTRNRSPIHYIGFRLLQILVKYLKFWPILLEKDDSDLPNNARLSKSKVIGLPSPGFQKRSTYKVGHMHPKKIGVVGMIRPDKPIAKLMKILEKFVAENDDFELIVGTPLWQVPANFFSPSTKIIDTTSREQFEELLWSLDIVATIFNKDDFFFRASGIINDAVFADCLVVAPDFPVFIKQIKTPVDVGETYSDIEKVGEAVRRAGARLNSGLIDFDSWRASRSDEVLLEKMSCYINDILS